jgi:hypothetical protein
MRSHVRHTTVAALWIGLAAFGACKPLRKQRVGSDAPRVVIFENQSLAQAAVYAVTQSGSDVRVGTVQPGRTDTLTLRPTLLSGAGTFSLVARLLAMSRTPSTGPLSLGPGEWIRVTLPPDARTLSVLPASP